MAACLDRGFLEVKVVQDCQRIKEKKSLSNRTSLSCLHLSSRPRISHIFPESFPIWPIFMGLLPNVSSPTAYTIPITSTTLTESPNHKSKHSPAPSQTMSSDSNMGSDPSTTPNLDRTPCMFAVKQFQRAAPSPEVDSGPSNVYTVHPSAIWDNLERFKHLDSTYQPTIPSPFYH